MPFSCVVAVSGVFYLLLEALSVLFLPPQGVCESHEYFPILLLLRSRVFLRNLGGLPFFRE